MVESSLRSLYENFEKSASGLLYWPELSTLESSSDDARLGKVFPVSFHFPAFFVARFVTTYWAGMMGLRHLLMSAYRKLAEVESMSVLNSTTERTPWPTSAGNVPPDLPFYEHRNEWKSLVMNICQSVEYFLQDKMGISGPLTILASLRACKRDLESDAHNWSREIEWIADILERMQQRIDFPVNHLFER